MIDRTEGHTRTPWRMATKADDILDPRGLILGAPEPATGNRTIIGKLWGEGPVTDANAALIIDARETARQRDMLLSALKGASVKPWGFCICPVDMEGRPDDDHTGECRKVRAAIAACDSAEQGD